MRVTGAAAATAAAAATPAVGYAAGLGPSGAAVPGPHGLAAVRAQVAALYQQAEAATQQYDATEERIAQLQAAVAGEGGQAARLRRSLGAAAAGLGSLAAQQYRDDALSPGLALVFAAQPDDYLERASLTGRLAELDERRIDTALSDREQLDVLEQTASEQMGQLDAAESQLAAHRQQIESRLAAVRAELALLTAPQRWAVGVSLGDGTGGYYPGLGLASPIQAPSLEELMAADRQTGGDARALAAVSSAYSELGKPYVWGATGPDEFDCSGLTQHSWGAAGVALPRTSQEQATAGQSVPLSQIQPGDLVIYYPGRTHVGIYAGRGLIIHAPHPGADVQFAPVTAMPINQIVQPS